MLLLFLKFKSALFMNPEIADLSTKFLIHFFAIIENIFGKFIIISCSNIFRFNI